MGPFYKQSLNLLAIPLIGFFIACSDTGSGPDSDSSTYTSEDDGSVTAIKTGSFKDSRDGQEYKTVTIGNQTWMAENLNYGKSGDCYQGKASNCEEYGRLYGRSESKGVCPEGWHLPYSFEWNKLTSTFDDGYALKSKSGWSGDDGNGTNAAGFNARPGGLYNGGHGMYYGSGSYAMFWINDNSDEDGYSNGLLLQYDEKYPTFSEYYKTSKLSVRCINDANTIVEKNGICGTGNNGIVTLYDSTYYICDSSLWRRADSAEIFTDCDSAQWGEIRSYRGISYICKDNSWNKADTNEVLGECDNLILGTIRKFNNKEYICKNFTWVPANKAEITFGMCTDNSKMMTKTLDSVKYFCNGKLWREYTSVEKNLGICQKSGDSGTYKGISFTCDASRNLWIGTFVDSRDGKSYKAVEINGNIWMAGNLVYGSGTYTWAGAMNVPENYNDSVYHASSTAKDICPDGWHLPDSLTFAILLVYMQQAGYDDFQSTTAWSTGNGTDLYGLNLSPAFFWSVTQESSYNDFLGTTYNKHYAYALETDQQRATVSSEYKKDSLYVRCVKNWN
jgi:uncharacterized protein (TIGR02145 family)